MKASARIRLFEVVLYTVILVAALSIVLWTGRSIRGGWDGVVVDWMRIAPFLLVFAVNNFLLCSKLLCCLALILAAAFFSEWIREVVERMSPLPHRDLPMMGEGRPPGPPPERMLHFYFGQLIVSLLIIGFNSGVKVFVRYAQDKIERGEREQQYLATELAYLKNQISPHFLMNTLNNIHALVDIDSYRAQDAIVKLSRMMRYLLYESADTVPLSREIEFIESYMELMRLRYASGEVEARFEYPENTAGVRIPAFLFLPLIENAFKHGICSSGGSFINIAVSLSDGRLRFTGENSIGNRHVAYGEASGIGVENIRKRLGILYGDSYKFEIRNDGWKHNVTLDIPV